MSVLAGKCVSFPSALPSSLFPWYSRLLLLSPKSTHLWICHISLFSLGFPGGSVETNPPANAEDVCSTPGWEDPLELEMATHGKSHGETSLWTTVCGVRKEMDKTMMKQQQQQSSLCTLAKVIFHYINITMPFPSLNFYLSPQFKAQIFTFLAGLFLVANDYFSSIISPLPTSFIQVLKVIKIHSNS